MRTYKNPFLLENQWSENECGDPFIMRFNGYYYLYCSSAGDYIKAWKSENLVDFTYIGSVCDAPEISGAYAPEVCYSYGKFYMVTSPMGSGHYLLEGERPEGPFHLISKNYGLMIDGSFFTDDNGMRYLLRAGHMGIIIHKIPEIATIDVNGTTISESYLNHWTEGPMIMKRKGYYYLTYTGNHLLSKGYRVAYSISNQGPDKGFVNLRDNTLLLENGEEFHALGHSSSFMAPDLDSVYIAYHNYDLDATPRKRSMNIDRLFFNGARMYCNPIWWEQEAPAMPEYYRWGEEGLLTISVKEIEYLLSAVKTPRCYTAEINVKTSSKVISLLYGYEGSLYGEITLCSQGSYEIKEGAVTIRKGKINNTVDFSNYTAVRLAKDKAGNMEIHINNMLLTSYRTDTGEGYLGVLKGADSGIGFMGISYAVEGNTDKLAAKAIPGRMDAIHGEGGLKSYPLEDAGFGYEGAILQKNKEVLYHVNIKENGCYRLIIRASAEEKEICLTVSCEESVTPLHFRMQGKGMGDFYKTEAGILTLTRGIKDIKITSSEDVLIDYFQFARAAEICDLNIVKNGLLAVGDLKIYGHKRQMSMLTKYSGFTCAENFGRAFIGEEGFNDYSVHTVIYRNNMPTGDVSVYVRVSRESWFPDQVSSSLFGYRIRVNQEGIFLYRCNYGEEQIGYYHCPCEQPGVLDITIQVKEALIQLVKGQETVFSYTDREGFLYGKIGLEATGEGFAFEEFSVRRELSI